MWGHPVWCVTENARFPLFTKLFSVIKLLLKARPIGEEMKRQVSIASLLTVLIMASTLITENAFAAGMKKAGPLVATSSTINTLLTGSTPPTSSVGKNGDVYIDVKNAILYGPKKKGVWPLGVSLKGNDGKSGIDGKNGSDGKAGAVSATTTAGPAGPQGPKGDVGPAGPAGADGANGSAGPAGQPGVAGADGAQGPRGETGPQGLKGDAGVSKGNIGTINLLTNLSGSAGAQTSSNNFGSFDGGSIYLVRYSIYAKSSDPSMDYAITTSLKRTNDAAPINVNFTVNKGVAFRDGVPSTEEVIHAEAIIDGTGLTGTFQLQASVSLGEGVGGATISLRGFYSQLQINAIG